MPMCLKLIFHVCHLFFVSVIVDKIDGNKDGYVTEEELNEWIKKAQKRYIYDNVDRQWKDFDMNNDGKITWEEYKNVTYGTYLGKGTGQGQMVN